MSSISFETKKVRFHRDGQLADMGVKAGTRKKYGMAVERFERWREVERVEVYNMSETDIAMAYYFQFLYSEGYPKNWASDCLNGCILECPPLKGHLATAAKWLKNWNSSHQTESHPPVTWPLACLIAIRMCLSGWVDEAVGVLLSFDCYLRPGELCGLAVADIAFPADARLGGFTINGMLRLRDTKTGPNQPVELRNELVIRMLACLVRGKAGVDPVFAFSYNVFGDRLKRVCSMLGLTGCGFTPHSLRAGGATFDAGRGVSQADIKRHGRWESDKVVKTYVQTGQALPMAITLPPAVALHAKAIADELEKSFLESLPSGCATFRRLGEAMSI